MASFLEWFKWSTIMVIFLKEYLLMVKKVVTVKWFIKILSLMAQMNIILASAIIVLIILVNNKQPIAR